MSTPVLAALQVPAQSSSVLAPPAQSAPAASTATSSAYDLDRLRAAIAAGNNQAAAAATPTTTVQPTQAPTDATAVKPTEATESRTMGDAILQGLSKINSGYNSSLDTINSHLNELAHTDPSAIGNNFSEMMGLQMEVARWSLSVTGVDNSSKAATNTVKELSRGG